MKLHITTHPDRKSLEIQWQMPGAAHPHSVYLLPEELTAAKYPHIVSDCGRIVSFWGDRLVMHESVGNISGSGRDGQHATQADVIHCNTYKLLEVLRTLHARQVRATDIETSSLTTVETPPLFTVAQLAKHPNMRDPERFGRTLKFFRDRLVNGDRTFAHLMRDLSRMVNQAWIFASGDEFYFNGRIEGGCGFNGGIILHGNTYGIHT